MEFKTEKKSFHLYDNGGETVYTVYTPRDLPKGIVQIFHGEGEHIGRYLSFAKCLCSRGFIVCGCDMPGFGESENEAWGYVGRGKALSTPCQTQKKLYDIMRAKYRYLPYMLYTMGMGTLIAKKFIYEYPDIIDGVVFGGTIGSFDGVTVLLAKILSLFKGKKGKSNYLDDRCFPKGKDEFSKENDEYSYISSLKEERDIYRNDPMCTRTLTVSSVIQLIDASREFEKNRWNELYPPNIYTLIISGKNDPIGNFGKAAVELQNELEEFSSVCDMECVLYENSRHDLLHDTDNEDVFRKALEFFEKVVDGINSARTTDTDIVR